MKVGVIDYNAGNLRSVVLALRHLGYDPILSADPKVLETTGRLVFPGDGHAKTSMDNLRARGLDELLVRFFQKGKPILGICVGSQIVLERSDEGPTVCLGLIEGECRCLEGRDAEGGRLKVPHMGWNTMRAEREHPLLDGIPQEASFYFVHSYYTIPRDKSHVLGTTEYGHRFVTAMVKDNLAAYQFHPEKSGKVGLRLVDNFFRWSK